MTATDDRPGVRLDPETQQTQTIRIAKRYITAAAAKSASSQGKDNAWQRFEIVKRMVREREYPEAVVLLTVAQLADQRALTKNNPEHFERSVRYQMDYLNEWHERYVVDAGWAADPHDGDEV